MTAKSLGYPSPSMRWEADIKTSVICQADLGVNTKSKSLILV